MQNHCDLWYKTNDEHCKRWKRGFDKQPAGMFMIDKYIYIYIIYIYYKLYIYMCVYVYVYR